MKSMSQLLLASQLNLEFLVDVFIVTLVNVF